MNAPVYIGAFGHALGDRHRSLADAGRDGLLVSPPEALAAGGFERHHVCSDSMHAYELARRAVAAIGSESRDVDAIVYATCIPENANLGSREAFSVSGDVRDLMQFAASRLQADLGLEAPVFGLDQQACTGMLGAIRLARSLVLTEPEFGRVLCVTADRFPVGARYEQSYNLISDGAAACIVGDRPDVFRILSCHQVTNGGLAGADDDETVGSYFAMTAETIRACLEKASLSVDDLDWIVPQNTQRDAWRVLASLLDFPFERIALETLSDVGHVISADNIVNLRHLLARGQPAPGQRVVLPMAGYGSNWQCLALARSQ